MRRVGVAAAVVLIAAGLGCVQTGSGGPERVEVAESGTEGGTGGTGIGFELAGPGGAALLVPVEIDGRGPYDLILDTGATLTCLDESLAQELELPEARGALGVGFGLGGQGGGQMRLVEVESLTVGDATAEGLTACTVDLSSFRTAGVEAHGLLGLNFLREFRVTLDFEAERLLLEEP